MVEQQEERPITFAIVEVGGKFARVLDPENQEFPDPRPIVIDQENVLLLEEDEQARLYGRVAGVPPKKFKTSKALLESLEYQASKLPLYGIKQPESAPQEQAGRPDARAANGNRTREPRKSADRITILSPANHAELFKKLPAQAKALITLMTELAGELGTTELPGAQLLGKLAEPRSIEMMSNTKQPPLRILGYYSSRLTSEGWIRTS